MPHQLKATWLNSDCSIERTCVSNAQYESKAFACAAGDVCVEGTCKSKPTIFHLYLCLSSIQYRKIFEKINLQSSFMIFNFYTSQLNFYSV